MDSGLSFFACSDFLHGHDLRGVLVLSPTITGLRPFGGFSRVRGSKGHGAFGRYSHDGVNVRGVSK